MESKNAINEFARIVHRNEIQCRNLELREIAKRCGMTGYHRLRKEALQRPPRSTGQKKYTHISIRVYTSFRRVDAANKRGVL